MTVKQLRDILDDYVKNGNGDAAVCAVPISQKDHILKARGILSAEPYKSQDGRVWDVLLPHYD